MKANDTGAADTGALHMVRAERYGRWVVKWRWPVLDLKQAH